MADQCAWWNVVCNGKKTATELIQGAAGDALHGVADAVTAAVIQSIASLGSLWTSISSASLTSGSATATAEPARGTFNAKADLILQYAAWLGLAVAVLAIIFLGITLVTNARRGDGHGIVNIATMVAGGAALIGGATSAVGFLVPGRSLYATNSVGFIQDQTMYLTLAIAAISIIIGGVQMVWTQRAEPVKQLIKGLITLAVVTGAGVTLLNVVVEGTDALAKQIIASAIGTDFKTDVMALLAMDNNVQSGAGNTWLGGNLMLIIVGGIIALLVNLIQIALMALRTGMLVLMAGVLPLSAAFLNTEMGRNFFQKVLGWTLAFVFYKPAAALIYGTAIKLTTTGLLYSNGVTDALLKFAAGLMLILASIVALPVLIGFLSPVLGAMGTAAGGSAMGVAAMAALVPQGAAHLARSGRGFGASGTAGGSSGSGQSSKRNSQSAPDGARSDASSGGSGGGPTSGPSGGGGGTGTGGSGSGAGGSGGNAAAKGAGTVGLALAAADAVKKTGEKVGQTVSNATASSAGEPGSDGAAGSSGQSAVGGISRKLQAAAASEAGPRAGWSGGPDGARPRTADGSSSGVAGGPPPAQPTRADSPRNDQSTEIGNGPDGANRS